MSACRDCIWWHQDGPDSGDCRRSAPRLRFGRDTEDEAVWPPTAADDWCGEHRHKGYALALAEKRAGLTSTGETGAC